MHDFSGPPRLGQISRGANDMCAVSSQNARRLDAEAGGDAGHQHPLAGEIDAFKHLVGRRLRAECLGHGLCSLENAVRRPRWVLIWAPGRQAPRPIASNSCLFLSKAGTPPLR